MHFNSATDDCFIRMYLPSPNYSDFAAAYFGSCVKFFIVC